MEMEGPKDKYAFLDGSDIWYSDDSTSDLASNDASTNSYESLEARSESLGASSDASTNSYESLDECGESLGASSDASTNSCESLSACSESLGASRESLTESNESLNEFYSGEESIACEDEPNKKTFMGDELRSEISEDNLPREDLFHVEEGYEEMLNDSLKYNFQ
ncbi:hypothetical protein PVIIG_01830 [Plasmodium vivax India VII]|uniref:Uncharacterized protein n=1 Tax=Plasmodium vivax India VII TaxID=1077284 RepID=A0A0J9SAS2_PLAVI|nr:hypothetical protein PVIIG_01830 [Plasmodium vivax India VII]